MPRVFETSKSSLLEFREFNVFAGSESLPIPDRNQSDRESPRIRNESVPINILTAIGRIGEKYKRDLETEHSRPTQSYSRGTGILITSKHILTSRHVYDRYIKKNFGKCGVEFLAIEGLDQSDFYLFSKRAPIHLENLDAVILTLAQSPNQNPLPIRSLDTPVGTKVKLIGYPHPIKFPDNIQYGHWDIDKNEHVQHDVQMYGGSDTVFSIKRQSIGQIFRPKESLPDQNHFFLAHDVFGHVPVFCFNATAGSGSSGSPVLSMNHDLLGVYFAGRPDFLGESANLAIPVNALLSSILRKDLKKLPDGQLNARIESVLAP